VQLLRPTAFSWKAGEMMGDWSLRFRSHTGVSFCLVAAGSCRLELPGSEPRRLAEGDYIMLAAPPDWTLSDGAPVCGIDFEDIGRRDSASVTRLVGGHFSFDEANAGLLTGLMPPAIEIRSCEASAGRLRGILHLIDDEAASDRPGRELIVTRLLEIMLVEAMRHGAHRGGEIHPGLLAGLGDRYLAAALRALHADIRRSWTVAQLASEAGMSRSVFAERFSRIVGMPPIDYVRQWRMALAKDALRFGTSRLAEVAFACGYESVSAFSTAFSRSVGCSPAKYAAGSRSHQPPQLSLRPPQAGGNASTSRPGVRNPS
jgi:AraC-like DNA-binding protein